uniref:ADP-ribosylation factor-like protein 2 n=1 Tax=Callithrix jacchus TaxID=9483 RepID=A0A8I3WME4_CALJA
MGLLAILKKMKQKEREVRLLMLGLDNAGKTTILKKFNGEDIDTISPTLGFNIKTLEHRGFKLNIWDVGGQKSLRSYWRNYFESTDGLIWVVDSADRQRMQDCHRELQSLLLEERLAGATLLIFANKQDLPGALSSNAIREALERGSLLGCSIDVSAPCLMLWHPGTLEPWYPDLSHFPNVRGSAPDPCSAPKLHLWMHSQTHPSLPPPCLVSFLSSPPHSSPKTSHQLFPGLAFPTISPAVSLTAVISIHAIPCPVHQPQISSPGLSSHPSLVSIPHSLQSHLPAPLFPLSTPLPNP